MPFYVYIMTNKTGSILYTGETRDLAKRVYEHKSGAVPGFTKRYKVNRLVYYEVTENAMSAFEREKAIKGGARKRKLELINSMNPEWRDLYEDF